MGNDSSRIIDFVVFVIRHAAQAWNVSASVAYEKLQSVGAVDDYLVPCYDVLHTLGAEYLVEDLTALLKDRGVAV